MDEPEYRLTQDVLDNYLLSKRGKTQSSIHLHECQTIRNMPDEDVLEKDTEIYPYGNRPVCRFCAHEWRRAWMMLGAVPVLLG